MPTPLEELRQLNVRGQQKKAASEVLESETLIEAPADTPGDNMTSHMTGNMTGQSEIHTPGNTTGNTASNPAVQKYSQKARQSAGRPVVLKGSQRETLPLGQPSVLLSLRQTAQQGNGADSQPLKTVTLKLPPALDRRIEEHCFHTGLKKQDVVRDALLLYFEMVVDTADGEEAA